MMKGNLDDQISVVPACDPKILVLERNVRCYHPGRSCAYQDQKGKGVLYCGYVREIYDCLQSSLDTGHGAVRYINE